MAEYNSVSIRTDLSTLHFISCIQLYIKYQARGRYVISVGCARIYIKKRTTQQHGISMYKVRVYISIHLYSNNIYQYV
jgi:hypothetical protein